MEYNKKQLTKLNDHKVLHKIRKNWVVVSIALLGVIGGATRLGVSANASQVRDSVGNDQITDPTAGHQSYQLSLSSGAGRPASRSISADYAAVQQRADELHNHILA